MSRNGTHNAPSIALGAFVCAPLVGQRLAGGVFPCRNLREAAKLMLEEGEVPVEANEPAEPGTFRESLTVLV
jgi:hypothetical protein